MVPGRTGSGANIDVSPTPVESKVRGGRPAPAAAGGCVCAAALDATRINPRSFFISLAFGVQRSFPVSRECENLVRVLPPRNIHAGAAGGHPRDSEAEDVRGLFGGDFPDQVGWDVSLDDISADDGGM